MTSETPVNLGGRPRKDRARIQLRLSPLMKANIDGVRDMIGLGSTQEAIMYLLTKSLETQIISLNASKAADATGVMVQLIQKGEADAKLEKEKEEQRKNLRRNKKRSRVPGPSKR